MAKLQKKIDCPALRMPRLALKIGEWKNLFLEEEYKLIISKTLNDYVCDVDEYHPRKYLLYIVGYMITKDRVYLVFDIETRIIYIQPEYVDEPKKIMQELIANLNSTVRDMIERIHGGNILNSRVIKNGDNTMLVTATELFEEFPFNNYQLVKLITGCKVETGYYSPQLARLKARIRNYQFCSAIDYSGGEGPVLIKKLNTAINEKEKPDYRKG